MQKTTSNTIQSYQDKDFSKKKINMNNFKTLQRDLFTSKFNSQPIFSQDFLPFSVITDDNTMAANLKMHAHTPTPTHTESILSTT